MEEEEGDSGEKERVNMWMEGREWEEGTNFSDTPAITTTTTTTTSNALP